MSSFLCKVTDNELPLLTVDKYHHQLIVKFESCLLSNSLKGNFNSNPDDLFFNFKHCNYNTFYTMLMNIDWSQIKFSNAVDVVVTKFCDQLYNILNT